MPMVHIFGWITTAKRPIGDIDLLVVCETAAAGTFVRAELALICGRYPIHLLVMTASEERELNFISGERAVEITSGTIVPTSTSNMRSK